MFAMFWYSTLQELVLIVVAISNATYLECSHIVHNTLSEQDAAYADWRCTSFIVNRV